MHWLKELTLESANDVLIKAAEYGIKPSKQ